MVTTIDLEDVSETAPSESSRFVMTEGADGTPASWAIKQYDKAATILGQPITGYTSGAGTVAATDSILQAIQKLAGNIAAVSDGWTYVKQASDVTNSTTSATDTSMAFIVAAGVQYEIEGRFLMRADATTTGVQPSISWPSGAADGAARLTSPNSATGSSERHVDVGVATQVSATGVPSADVSTLGSMMAIVIGGASPSTFRVRVRSEVGGSTVTIKAGSFIRHRIVP